MSQDNKKYSSSGVTISKNSLKEGDKVTISYNGLLVNCGADSVYAYVGYNKMWEEKEYIPMKFEDGFFTASFKLKKSGTLNISFKDGADNWDNNSFANYTFEISAKKASSATTAKTQTKKKSTSTSSKVSKTKKTATPKATAKKKTAVQKAKNK